MRILNRLYNRLLSSILGRFGATIRISDSSINKLCGLSISAKGVDVTIRSVLLKRLYYAFPSRQIVAKFSIFGMKVSRGERCAASLGKAAVKAKFKGGKAIQLETSIPGAGTLHIRHDGNETFFKTTSSADEVIGLLPEIMAQTEHIKESVKDGVNILAYYNSAAETLIPRLNYAVKGFSPPVYSAESAQSLKQEIIYALKAKNHIADNYVGYDEIPKLIKSVVICTEDPAYMLHKGVCPYALGLMVKTILSKKLPQGGGSTITQQLMRNAFFSGEPSAARKIREFATALMAENYYSLSKQDILEVYLNMAEMGNGLFGFGDASVRYFGKPLGQLTVVEALTLSYILPRPIHFENALAEKSEQLRRNLKGHILKFLPILVTKKVIADIRTLLPIGGVDFVQPYGRLTFDVPGKLAEVEYIIIHCSATPYGEDIDADGLRLMHLQRGFDDVGYHWVIKIDGTVEKGRDMSLQGAHSRGYNHNSIGVCYIGGIDENQIPANTMTEAQEESLAALCKELKSKYPSAKIIGHNQISDKCCPCFDVEQWVKRNGI